jgi:hypothetical protein
MNTFLVRTIKGSVNDAPSYVSTVDHRVAIRGDFVYVADGYTGLSVYQLGLGGAAPLVGEYHTGKYARNVRADAEFVYVDDYSPQGMTVLDARNPMQLRAMASSEMPKDTRERFRRAEAEAADAGKKAVAAIVEDRLYIARQDVGVIVILLRGARNGPPIGNVDFLKGGTQRTAAVARVEKTTSSTAANQSLPLAPEALGPSAQSDGAVPNSPQAPAVQNNPLNLEVDLAGTVLRLRAWAVPGQTIRIQRSAGLRGPWVDWTSGLMRVDSVEFYDSPTQAQVFYRAVAE